MATAGVTAVLLENGDYAQRTLVGWERTKKIQITDIPLKEVMGEVRSTSSGCYPPQRVDGLRVENVILTFAAYNRLVQRCFLTFTTTFENLPSTSSVSATSAKTETSEIKTFENLPSTSSLSATSAETETSKIEYVNVKNVVSKDEHGEEATYNMRLPKDYVNGKGEVDMERLQRLVQLDQLKPGEHLVTMDEDDHIGPLDTFEDKDSIGILKTQEEIDEESSKDYDYDSDYDRTGFEHLYEPRPLKKKIDARPIAAV